MKVVPTISVCALAACTALAGNAFAEGGRSRPKMAAATPLARPALFPNGVFAKGGDPGDDDTAISLAPNLSALCQSYIGHLNTYSNPRPNVDQINDDQFVLAGTQLGCNTAQNETTIAVNPSNPRNLVAGTNDYRVFNTRENRNDGSGYAYTTFDGGHSWLNVQLPHLTIQTGATGLLSDMDSAGDPAVAFGPNNTVYYANLVFSRLNLGSGIVVSKSTDGGRTWGEPSIVHTDGVDANGNGLNTNYGNDKEWITVDQDTGTVYVTWTLFGPTGSPIEVSSSTDGGASWSAPVEVNPSSAFTPGGITPYSQGSNPRVNRHGDLFIAYESAVCQSLACDRATDHDAVIIATSRDGGRTFTNREVAYDFDFPRNADTGRDTLTGENFRINSFPQLTIDPVTDALYATWSDDRNGLYDSSGHSIKTNGDVFIIASRDGRHWSRTYGVGTGADEVYPAIAAYGGQVAVSFYTRVYEQNGIGLDMAYVAANAEDLNSLSHRRVHRVTTQTSNPQIQFVAAGLVTGNVLQGVFIGDYTAVALGSDGVLHPCWTDFRGEPGVTAPNQDAYTQAISLDD
ncbi:MAG TPA: sialidase family protein [Steroidobacteraceae bacterium]|nr:sialidase family protein [Steroidobacteraceae bacterium]